MCCVGLHCFGLDCLHWALCYWHGLFRIGLLWLAVAYEPLLVSAQAVSGCAVMGFSVWLGLFCLGCFGCGCRVGQFELCSLHLCFGLGWQAAVHGLGLAGCWLPFCSGASVPGLVVAAGLGSLNLCSLYLLLLAFSVLTWAGWRWAICLVSWAD